MVNKYTCTVFRGIEKFQAREVKTMKQETKAIGVLVAAAMAFTSMPGVALAAGNIAVDESNFPDDDFRSYISSNVDSNHDGQLSSSEISNCSSMYIYGDPSDQKYYYSFEGIENLTSLKYIQIDGCSLYSVDLSALPNLLNVSLTNDADLETVTFGQHDALTGLTLQNTPVRNVNLSGMPQLSSLDVVDTDIQTLDISSNPEIAYLDCCGNRFMTSINIGSNPHLIDAYEHGDYRAVDSYGYEADAYDFSGGMLVVSPELAIESGSVSIDINETNFPDSAFRDYVSENYDLNDNGVLSAGEINAVTEIDIVNYYDEDSISDLKGIEYFTAATYLEIWGTAITSLDISALSSLHTLYLGCNPDLSSVTIGQNNELGYIYIQSNDLSSIDVSGCPALDYLFIWDEPMTSVDISNNAALSRFGLICEGADEINISGNPNLLNAYNEGTYEEHGYWDDYDFEFAIYEIDEYCSLSTNIGATISTEAPVTTPEETQETAEPAATQSASTEPVAETAAETTAPETSDTTTPEVPATSSNNTAVLGATRSDVSVSYCTHVQNIGWQDAVADGVMAGTEGQSLRLEGMKINVISDLDLGIRYCTHVQNIGWMDWSYDGAMSGTEGLSYRLEAMKIELTGADAADYDVYYRVHVQNIGWMDWAKNGQMAGTEGQSLRLEGMQIKIVRKGEPVNFVSYNTHVQNVGWQAYVTDGVTAGTTGRSLRLEGIHISVDGLEGVGVQYRTHIQNIGWEENWSTDGEFSGTEGQSLRLEAIEIRLTGENAAQYDIYYRTHVQNFGWTGWASNGASCGSAGYAYRLEGIEIMIVPAGSPAPGSTSNAFYQA